MKKVMHDVVKWMTILGNFGVLIGCFLPYAVGYNWITGERQMIGMLIGAFKAEGHSGIKVALLFMGIAMIVSFVALNSFGDSGNVKPSIAMLVAAFVGKYAFEVGSREMYAFIESNYYPVEKSIGATLPGKIYMVLIIGAILAFGVEIYINYISSYLKEIIVPMGSSSCPKCGKTISSGNKFCAACGFSLDTLKCPECGAEREMNSQFCKECGKRLPVINMGGSGYGPVTHKSEVSKSEMAQRISDLAQSERNVGTHWTCKKCGEENAGSLMFCHKCGSGK